MRNLKNTQLAPHVVSFLDIVRTWAAENLEISAVALAGSHAHGRARPESDIDLVVLSDTPEPLRSRDWLPVFGSVDSVKTEQFGILTAHHTSYAQHGEVEVGVAPTSWASVPVDEGTRRVVSDGIVIVYDRSDMLQRLVWAVTE